MRKQKRTWRRFEPAATPGFIHADVKYLTRLQKRRSYLYVAIDRATRYVYSEVLNDLHPATAAGFLQRVLADFALPVRVILTDNRFEWTDRYAGDGKKHVPGQPPKESGRHAVLQLCWAHEIDHRKTRPRRPQTNGMVERFNRRLSEWLSAAEKIKANSGNNCFATHAARNRYIARLVHNYNRTRQTCLQQQSPLSLIMTCRNATRRRESQPPPKRDSGLRRNGESF